MAYVAAMAVLATLGDLTRSLLGLEAEDAVRLGAEAGTLLAVGLVLQRFSERLHRGERGLAALRDALADAYDHLERSVAERLHGERLAVLGRMSSYLSNKVNKALAAAVGYSELALAADGMPGQAKDDLKVASAELVQAGRALRDLLFFMEAPDVKPAPCDLNLVVAESVEVSRPAAVARGVAITATLDRALPSIPFDGPHLRRLCDELLANALAATPSGRAIAVYTGRGATHAVIGFVDQGDGIPPHVQDQLFEPFATEKYSGLSTGMGLLVVQSINRAHGWEIDVRTDTEAGTAISITIPLTTQAETRPADSVAARA